MKRTARKNHGQGWAVLQLLEARAHLSVSQDAAGWTVVTPALDTRVIYVSNSSGNDGNNGSLAAPVKTLSKAQSLVGAGKADWVLLKRGDTFESFGVWKKSGRSPSEPIYISAYGTGARPQINSGSSYGFITFNSNGRTDNLIISSLSFTPNTYNGSNGTGDTGGIRLLAAASNVTIEDCRIVGYKDDITLGDSSGNATHAVTDVAIRRCQILDSYSTVDPTSTHSQGIYIDGQTQRVTIEENVFDHNGWRQGTPSDRTFFNHNIYSAAGASGIVVRNNIISQASFYGMKLNSGGTVSGNLLARNSVSIYLENAATISDNVITEAVEMPTQDYGWGIDTYKANSGTIHHNLITKMASTGTSNMLGIKLNDVTDSSSGINYRFTGTVDNNIIYDWKNTGIDVTTKGNGAGSVTLQNNQIQVSAASNPTAMNQSSTAAQSTFVYGGNTYFATGQTNMNRIGSTRVSLSTWKSTTGESDAKYQAMSYPDPTRDIERYSTAVGGAGTFADFIANARAMDKLNWNSVYTAAAANAWIWQGFGSAPIVPAVLSATFGYDTQPMTLDVKFTSDVAGLDLASAVTVRNVATNALVPFVFGSYSGSTATARYVYNGTLADGNYRANILAAAAGDLTGTLSSAPFTQDFFFQMGDANHDRTVNALDFSVLATNFGKTGRTFSQGDFNFDGTVNAVDFAMLATSFNTTVSAPAAALTQGTLFSAQGISGSDRDLFAVDTADVAGSSEFQ